MTLHLDTPIKPKLYQDRAHSTDTDLTRSAPGITIQSRQIVSTLPRVGPTNGPNTLPLPQTDETQPDRKKFPAGSPGMPLPTTVATTTSLTPLRLRMRVSVMPNGRHYRLNQWGPQQKAPKLVPSLPRQPWPNGHGTVT